MTLVPMVVEQTNRGERSYDIYSRLLKDRTKTREFKELAKRHKPNATVAIFQERKSFLKNKKKVRRRCVSSVVLKYHKMPSYQY